MIKAIETKYRGYRFRSRLEARWAVFFDALGIEYQYEPQGYEKSERVFVGQPGEEDDESKWPEQVVQRYLPDFYLPKMGTWVEVKGNMTAAEASRLASFLDWGCPLPFFTNSAENGNDLARHKERIDAGVEIDGRAGLLVLGEVPEPVHGVQLHRFVRHYHGLHSEFAFFDIRFGDKGRLTVANHGYLQGLHHATGVDLQYGEVIDGCFSAPNDAMSMFDPRAVTVKTFYAYKKVVEAYHAARSARFEHGENGGVQ